jgi:S-adenosyl methyltransferase
VTDDDWTQRGIDVNTPSVARLYDYYLGGKDNFAVDRAAAEEALAAAPEIRPLARANRAFLGRAVQYLAKEVGIRQFIDIGTGLPTQGSVHEAVFDVTPDAGVVYVDRDPMVIRHSEALLSKNTHNVATLAADLREPDALFADPALRAVVDLAEPVAVLILLLLHFVTDDECPGEIIARIRDTIAPGSYIVISHVTPERRESEVNGAVKVYERASSTVTPRSREQIEKILDGFELVEPGLVFPPEWRPDVPESARVRNAVWGVLAGVGRKI